jgi:PAS domain S-box-containing protein
MKVKERVQLLGINTDLFSTLHELVCITDAENRIRYVNPALQKRIKPQQSKVGKPGFWEVSLDTVSAKSTPVEFDKAYSPLLKEWFDLAIHYCEVEKGEPLFIWIAKELFVEKETQVANATVNNFGTINELYHTLFETSPSGILLLDEKGIIIDVNQSSCTSNGYKPAELIGRHVRVLAHPDNHRHIESNIKQILSGKTLKQEVTSLRKDGSFYYSLLIESAVSLPDGNMAILSVSNDITERKKAEFTLRERESWFRTIANHTANWESLFSFEGRIIWTNPAAERFTGYSPEEIIAMPDFIEVLVARPDRAKAREVVALALEENEGYEYFFRCIRKDGTYFWLSLAWAHLRDENDKLIGIRTSGQDVTLRLEALQALKNSESLYRHMIENAPFGMHFFEVNDEDELIFTHANPAADIILNQDHLKIAGKKIEEAFPLLVGSEAPQKFKEAALGNKTWITEKLKLNGLSGSLAFEVKAFQTAKGKMVAIFADISKRFEAEEQLRESRQLFETLARMAPVGIFRTNEAGETTFVNPRWSALTGLSFSEALQNKYVGAIHPSDREDRIKEWYYAVKHKIPVISEYRFVRPDGSVIWVQGQAIPETVDGQVKGYIGTITDITELIEIQDDLRAAKEKAEASNRLKTTFMKNLSHEIRTPLNGIFGFAQLIGSGDYSSEENDEFIGLLEGSITRMTKTIDNTMELSMLMTGNMQRNDALFNLGSLMHEVFRSFRPEADKKNLGFSLRSAADTGLMVVTDRMMLKRIVEEIADNSFKFTDKGKVTLDYKLEDDIIQIVITDTGQGITPEYLPLIFEPFMQENVYTARAYNSPGLGLSIVHGLASLLGGHIKADSLLGQGTTISLRLPVRTTSKSKDAPAVRPADNDQPEREPIILIVEDEQINMMFIKRLLGKYKCKLIEATNGREALAKVKKHPLIDIVLMDIRMPGMDGFQAIELIRELNPSIKIAAVTAYGSASDREACLASGCVEYIAKPFNSKDLFSMLRRVIQWPPEYPDA